MSNIDVVRKNLGPVTAYKYAVQQGYTGTEQEFAALMASYATVAEEAEAAKDDAIDAKTAAEEAQAAAEAAAQTLVIDNTLTQTGQAADSKATGDAIAQIVPGLSETAKATLLACFEHVAWTDEHGQTYYDALESALYTDKYPKITATFNSGTNIIYTDDDISSLKQYLTVKHYESASDSGTTVSANDYTLTGVLTEGTSTISVAYNNLATVFTISGVVNFYNIWKWNYTTGQLKKLQYGCNPGRDNSPTRIDLNPTDTRRTFLTERGKAPYYYHNNDSFYVSPYYPIPIPADANYFTVKGVPTGFYFYTQVFEYDEVNGVYLDARSDSRFAWTQQTNDEPLGHVIVANNGNYFFGVNLKDSSSSSHVITTEPTDIEIVFSVKE